MTEASTIPGLTAEMATQIPRHPGEGKAPLKYSTMSMLVSALATAGSLVLVLVPLNVLSGAAMWPSLAGGTVMYAGASLAAKWRAHWYYQLHSVMVVERIVTADMNSHEMHGFRVVGYNRGGQLRQGFIIVHKHEYQAKKVGDVISVAGRLRWP